MTMIRKTFLLGLVVAATALTAQALVTQGAKGAGLATAANGTKGEFQFSVVKQTSNGQTRMEGGFHFWTGSMERRIHVSLNRLAELTVDGNEAKFAGPARVEILTRRNRQVIPGALSVKATDRRRDGQGDPDRLVFRFQATQGNYVLEFEGDVTRGDISVFSREVSRVIEGAEGHGLAATSTTGPVAEFQFAVKRDTVNSNDPRLKGTFNFHSRSNDRKVHLVLPRVSELTVDGNAAKFGGAAKMAVMTAAGVERLEGTATVVATDNRRGNQGDPDRLVIRFESTTGVVYEFEGSVTRGNIAVFKHTL